MSNDDKKFFGLCIVVEDKVEDKYEIKVLPVSYVPDMKRQKWAQVLHKIADAPQKPIREMLPQNMPLDPTPMIIIILVQMLMYLL